MEFTDVQLTCGEARAAVRPGDGLVVTTFAVGSKTIIYPDGIIESNGKKKRRGGIPILFPQAGAVTDLPAGFRLAQHGFARDQAWETVQVSGDARRAEFRLSSSADTRANFPFDFEVRVTIEIGPASLYYILAVTNPSTATLWTAPGLHPYFAIPPDRRIRLKTSVSCFHIDTYRLDESLILPRQRVDLEIPGTGLVSMIPGGDFMRPQSRLVVWSDRIDYMCFEPWSAGVGSLFRAGERLDVAPGGTAKMSMRIELSG